MRKNGQKTQSSDHSLQDSDIIFGRNQIPLPEKWEGEWSEKYKCETSR